MQTETVKCRRQRENKAKQQKEPKPCWVCSQLQGVSGHLGAIKGSGAMPASSGAQVLNIMLLTLDWMQVNKAIKRLNIFAGRRSQNL